MGVAVKADAEGGRFARSLGAEAVYMPDMGRPGMLFLDEHPTCAEVLEELIHIGQHRRAGWGDVSGDIPSLEMEAQLRMARKAIRWGWPQADLDRLARAWAFWESKL